MTAPRQICDVAFYREQWATVGAATRAARTQDEDAKGGDSPCPLVLA